jgi:hypothetical protein
MKIKISYANHFKNYLLTNNTFQGKLRVKKNMFQLIHLILCNQKVDKVILIISMILIRVYMKKILLKIFIKEYKLNFNLEIVIK